MRNTVRHVKGGGAQKTLDMLIDLISINITGIPEKAKKLVNY